MFSEIFAIRVYFPSADRRVGFRKQLLHEIYLIRIVHLSDLLLVSNNIKTIPYEINLRKQKLIYVREKNLLQEINNMRRRSRRCW